MKILNWGRALLLHPPPAPVRNCPTRKPEAWLAQFSHARVAAFQSNPF